MTPANTSSTRITGLKRWPGFFEALRDTVVSGTQEWRIGNRTLHAYHNWFRDHIHILKFARYFDRDPGSALQYILENQHSSGFFYEILTHTTDGHASIIKDEFRRFLKEPVTCQWRKGRKPFGPHEGVLLRLELEPDIEYLVVEGVARAWEATGDTRWMEAALPALQKGLRYSLSHPDRFDPEHGLVKRPFTIDTWDFAWGQSTADRGIHPNTPMAIHYGDNAGVYSAARWLSERIDRSRAFQARGEGPPLTGSTPNDRSRASQARDEDTTLTGSTPDALSWEEWAGDLRRRTNEVCWNGRFYTHQVLLDPVNTGGYPEEEILSLSNTYAINRGMTNHEQAVSIINQYLRLREETKDLAFAEWFTIYPPYPDFAGHKQWDYVNGGIAPFIGGELATAAFNHGYEWYGVDILDRLYQLWKRDGRLLFLYSKEGTTPENSWGPVGWGAAGIGQAILEGLAGVKMNVAEKTIQLTLRWNAAGEDDVMVEAVYPSSGYGVRYRYLHLPAKRTVRILCWASGTISLSVLLSPDSRPSRITTDGNAQAYRLFEVEKSTYVSIPGLLRDTAQPFEIMIEYQ